MTNYPVDEVVPHSGTMSLLDNIVDSGDDWLIAEVLIKPDTLFINDKGVPAWVGIEYMAQSIGAYAGTMAKSHQQNVKLGFLLGTRKYTSSVSNFPLGSRLLIKVEKELQSDDGLGVFNCSITAENILVSARLNVFQPRDSDEFFAEEGLKHE